MADFKELQTGIQKARTDRNASGRSAFTSTERLKKLRREKERALRSVGQDSNIYQALLAREAELVQAVAANEARFSRHVGATNELYGLFEQFTDPRTQLGELSDEYPILLFPVRLEVRFKRLPQPGGGVQHQLWVRIFPDECSIETFDETLTEAEVERARDYWTSRWKAGNAVDPSLETFVHNKARGAWRELMGIFNAGRAYWIEQHYVPVNAGDIPERNSETDTILVVRTEALPAASVQDALRAYWSAVWMAAGEAGAVTAALGTLVNTLGITEDNARALIGTYEPHNIADELKRADPAASVQVAFLVFPTPEDVDTKLAAWSDAAKVTTLPERFVLLGFQEGNTDPVVHELGRLIPDPLVVGPSPGIDINDVLTAVYGEAFADLTDDEKAERYVEYLSERSDTKWLFDFDAAIAAGMGFKVDISQAMHDSGFQRLFVLGVQLSANESAGQSSLEQLIKNHHFGESGFAILPQGAPTNNTEDGRSNYSVTEDANEAYDRYHSGPQDDPLSDVDKRDGRWLAELLGVHIKEATLDLVHGYYGTDQRDARAMNTALWNATIGYFMESMVTPVFSDDQRDLVRWFLLNHVSGRGRVPAVRIGDQPYGILPVTTVSDMQWLSGTRNIRRVDVGLLHGLQQIYTVLLKVKAEWELQLDKVAYVGKTGNVDAHAIVLQVLGLHATSVTFDQRYAQSFQHFFNVYQMMGILSLPWTQLDDDYKQRGMDLLRELGYVHDEKLNPDIPILEKFFLGREHNVDRPLIDDRALSETEPIRAYTDVGLNYIEWLIENAQNDHSAIRNKRGFSGNRRPSALLFDLLRHSINLAFGNTALNLYRNASVLTAAQVSAIRVDADFIGIQEGENRLESKWDLMYRSDDRVASDGALVVDHISDLIRLQVVNSQTSHLQEIIAALNHLKDVPTARLERAFVEHLDCCTYRLDAWLLGLVNAQLGAMRFGGLGGGGDPKSGVYLGAYGWLENVKPDKRTLEPANLSEELRSLFDPSGDKDITTDDTNAGYVHAPSINHALTAAVLRNAYISNASRDEAEPFKVNLSSERVRLAISIIEGIQQGQSLAALLGYQLERGLHDSTDQELDLYIYELRKVFPLVSNRMVATQIKVGKVGNTPDEAQRIQEEEEEFEADKAVTKVEARNVVNGLALVDHVTETGNKTYPFGFPIGDGVGKLKAATEGQREAINAQVERLLNIRDAVADVAMAEGVHQVVQGNYDRAAGALDTYSKGGHPQLPDVVRSPGSGVSITHRVGIHLPTGVIPNAGDTPRAKAEPAVNKWLEDLFPTDLSTVACLVEYQLPDYEATGPAITSKPVSMAQLGLMPIDLLYMMSGNADKSLTALDDHVLRFVHADDLPRPDIELEIKYTHIFDPLENKISFFELASLIESARTLVGSSRPLSPTDIALPNESVESQNASLTLPPGRILAAKESVDNLVGDLKTDVVDPLKPSIDAEDFEITVGNAAAILSQLDARISNFVNHMHQLSLFGFPQAGFGFVFDRIQAIHAGIYRKVVDYKKRWQEKQATYDDLINVQLPAAATDDERFAILQKAEKTISTESTVPVPATVPAYVTILGTKKSAFDAKLGTFTTFIGGSASTLNGLLTDARALTTNLGDFDFEVFDLVADERQMIVLAEDLVTQATKTSAALTEKTTAVQALLSQESASTDAKEKVKLTTEAAKLLFGAEFTVIPEFQLSQEQGSELNKCLDDQSQLLDYQTNVQSNDFPVDDWLYGIARVREKLGVWENLVMLAEGVRDRPSLDLTPLQLPYVENDHWVALAYPEGFEVTSDKLLYTAYLQTLDATQPQCGLLIDEWTEVIPARRETTGMTFHYDRPNSEPPQAMLLVTPAAFTGAWSWTEVLQTMHETLDLARMRAVEPDHIDQTRYAQFLPATVTAVTTYPVTMAMNYSVLAGQVFDFQR